MDVEAVADQLGPDIGVLDAGGDDTGIAVVDAGHGVVQVGQVGDTGVNGSAGMVIVGIGVGDGDGAQLAGLLHELGGTGQFGGHIHDADQTAAAVEQGLEALKIGGLQVVGVLGAALGVGEVGALHLDAAQAGAAGGLLVDDASGGGEGSLQHIVGQGHGGGGEGSDAAAEIELGHLHQTLVRAVGEVVAGGTVAVDLDQAGDDGGTAQIDGISGDVFGQDGTELAVDDLEGTGTELAVNEDSCIGIEHGSIPPIHCSFVNFITDGGRIQWNREGKNWNRVEKPPHRIVQGG